MPQRYTRLTEPLVREEARSALPPGTGARSGRGRVPDGGRNGPRTFGMFSCSKATNEMNFVAQKFTRSVIGSNNIDSCNRT
jgi:formate dehydrogenase major subunit